MAEDILLKTDNSTHVICRIFNIIKEDKTPVFILDGELGAGKTYLVKKVLAKLGYSGGASPTFVLLRFYKTPEGGVAHYDLYRILKENANVDIMQLIESTTLLDYIGRYPTFIEWGKPLLSFLESMIETGLYIINIRILDDLDDKVRFYEVKKIK